MTSIRYRMITGRDEPGAYDNIVGYSALVDHALNRDFDLHMELSEGEVHLVAEHPDPRQTLEEAVTVMERIGETARQYVTVCIGKGMDTREVLEFAHRMDVMGVPVQRLQGV